jgi:hypothetical protein
MSAGLHTQEFVDTVTEPGEYPDGDETRLVFVAGPSGKRRQYYVRSRQDAKRLERIGAASMHSLERVVRTGNVRHAVDAANEALAHIKGGVA